jgi:hypothetical protein
VKLVHLVGFITKKFITMHCHMNVKLKMVLTSMDSFAEAALLPPSMKVIYHVFNLLSELSIKTGVNL